MTTVPWAGLMFTKPAHESNAARVECSPGLSKITVMDAELNQFLIVLVTFVGTSAGYRR